MVLITTRVGKSISIETSERIGFCKYTLSKGTLPPGVFLSQSGKISGSPQEKGNYSFSIREKCGKSCSIRNFTIVVRGEKKKVCEKCDPNGLLPEPSETLGIYLPVENAYLIFTIMLFRGNVDCIFNQADVASTTTPTSNLLYPFVGNAYYDCRSNQTILLIGWFSDVSSIPTSIEVIIYYESGDLNVDIPLTEMDSDRSVKHTEITSMESIKALLPSLLPNVKIPKNLKTLNWKK